MTPTEALATLKRLAELRSQTFSGRWEIGLIEDTPGERYLAIGANGLLFMRLPYIEGLREQEFLAAAKMVVEAANTDFPALAEAVEAMENPPVVESSDVGSTITSVLDDGSYRITSKSGQVRRVTFFRSMREMELADQLAAANAEIARLKEQLKCCDQRIVNQRAEIANLSHELAQERAWVKAYRDKLGRFDGLVAIDEMQAEIARLKTDLADHLADVRRIAEWRATDPRQPAALAFTAGPERVIADLIESKDAEIARLRERVRELEGQRTSRCPLCDEPTIDGAELCEDCADDLESEGGDGE